MIISRSLECSSGFCPFFGIVLVEDEIRCNDVRGAEAVRHSAWLGGAFENGSPPF